jgi:glycosyltransferase involved in cell wall biosynthesis
MGISDISSGAHSVSTARRNETVPLSVAYATTYDAADVSNWSGLGYYIAKALELQSIQLSYVGPLQREYELAHKAKKWLILKLLRKKYLIDRAPRILQSYARQVERSLASLRYDAVVSPGTAPLVHLETSKPTAFWTDSTFAGMLGYYEAFSDLTQESVEHGCRAEATVLARCRLAIYSSEWAARSAIERYPQFAEKVKVVPFGANITCNRSGKEIKELVKRRASKTCNLLFVGVEWHRKGGDIAVQVAEHLRKEGLDTTLSVVGCSPSTKVPEFVKLHGFISKRTPVGRKQLERLFEESHFFLLPARAECFGIVLAEANSFGIPVLTSEAGGIPTIVRNDLNGRRFPNLDVSAMASCILDLTSNPQRYADLALSSFREYETRLNWRTAGRQVKDLLTSVR